LAKRCDAGTDCGACCAQIRAMISDRYKSHLRLVGCNAA
jgi:bacterioferritin-associated ferredoxin